MLFKNGHTINQTHGRYNTPEHVAWRKMHQRCYDKNDVSYKWYGARGIRICDKWFLFTNFFNDMGLKPGPEYSLDRIDNDKDYEPGNCKWSTEKEQANNRGHIKGKDLFK